MDKEVLREIWQGQLPLCFKLHSDDVIGMHRPEPYYMMVPRITYFPLVLDRALKYFNRFIDQTKESSNNDIWLDYDGQPIKWQHPIGLSWDLLGSSYDLPWRLILHFSDFPSKELVRCNTKSSIETNFISSIKEADTLKHKGTVIKNMVKKDQNQLWSSLVNEKFDQFWQINKRLMERTDNELFRYIPFRLYFPDYTYVQKVIRPCTTTMHIFQNIEKLSSMHDTNLLINSPKVPVVFEYDTETVMNNKTHRCSHTSAASENADKANNKNLEGHRCTTLLDLIQASFADRMNNLLVASHCESIGDKDFHDDSDKAKCADRLGSTLAEESKGETAAEQEEKGEAEEGEVEDEEEGEATNKLAQITSQRAQNTATFDKLIDVQSFRYRFMTHGIEIPFDTPLQWLSEHFSYPDNFLHICAVIKDNTGYS